MIKIINIEIGNVMSIKNAFKKIKVKTEIIIDPKHINNAKGIILPGVGSFDSVMSKLKKNDWINVLNHEVLENKIPILGICAGMQIMGNSSEEGCLSGLGWINAEVKKITNQKNLNKKLPLPHIGWAHTEVENCDRLFLSKNEEMRFYFVHGYYMVCNNKEDLVSKIFYGDWITASISKSNIYGVQFHPEKSHIFGQKILKRFSELCI
jgi:glutamine amidotransferase